MAKRLICFPFVNGSLQEYSFNDLDDYERARVYNGEEVVKRFVYNDSKKEVWKPNEEVELTATAIKVANKITISAEGNDKPWFVILKNVSNVQDVQGGSFEIKEDGAHITPAAGNKEIVCYLNN